MPGLMTTADKDDIQQAERRTVQELRQRASRQISGVDSPNDAHVRDILPNEDLDVDDADNDNGWNGSNREWLQAGMTADQLNQVYEIDSSGQAEDKVFGIFAVSSIAADVITSEIVFEDGTGSRFERLMFDEAQTLSEGEYALFRNPIIFNEGKDGYVYQWAKNAGDERLVYHGAVAEKPGTTLGVRAQTENAASNTVRTTK